MRQWLLIGQCSCQSSLRSLRTRCQSRSARATAGAKLSTGLAAAASRGKTHLRGKSCAFLSLRTVISLTVATDDL